MITQKQEQQDRKSVHLSVSVSPVLKKELEELVERGYFSNVSDAVKYAIHDMLAKFRAEGKLKAKPAEEIVKEIELKKHKPVKEEDLGEEVVR